MGDLMDELGEVFGAHGFAVSRNAQLEGRTGQVYTASLLCESDEGNLLVESAGEGLLTAAVVTRIQEIAEDAGADAAVLWYTGPIEPDARRAAGQSVILWDRAALVRILGSFHLAKGLGQEPEPLPLDAGDICVPDAIVAESVEELSESHLRVAGHVERMPVIGGIDEEIPDLSALAAAAEQDAELMPIAMDAIEIPADDIPTLPEVQPVHASARRAPTRPDGLDFHVPDFERAAYESQAAPPPPSHAPPAPVQPAYEPPALYAPAPPAPMPTYAPPAPAYAPSPPVFAPPMAGMPQAPQVWSPPVAPPPSPAYAQYGQPQPFAAPYPPAPMMPPMPPLPPPMPPMAPTPTYTPPYPMPAVSPDFSFPPAFDAAASPSEPLTLDLPSSPYASPNAYGGALPTPTATRVPMLPVRLTPEDAAIKANHCLFGVSRHELVLQPVHLFDYECDLLRDGSLRSDTVDGRVQVHGSDKSCLAVDPDQVNPSGPTLMAVPPAQGVHEKVLRVSPDRAKQLATEAIQKLHTRLIDVAVRESGSYGYTEKRKMAPQTEHVRLTSLGIHHRPVWRLYGSNGQADVDAMDGRVLDTQVRNGSPDAMVLD